MLSTAPPPLSTPPASALPTSLAPLLALTATLEDLPTQSSALTSTQLLNALLASGLTAPAALTALLQLAGSPVRVTPSLSAAVLLTSWTARPVPFALSTPDGRLALLVPLLSLVSVDTTWITELV